jgi:kynureninase
VTVAALGRAAAAARDAADPLAAYADRFVVAEPDLRYLDGNSLGRLPKATVERLRAVVEHEWGTRLIRSWNESWVDLPARVGDALGSACLGAGPGQVVIADSTTVNLYKLAAAALAQSRPRRTIVADTADFPTDRYVVEGLGQVHGARPRFVTGPAEVGAALDDDVALVVLSVVDYRTGALADVPAITAAAHEAGALVLWDGSHAVGAVPLELDAWGVDLAVGCTYKYLNGGPGAPAFAYVRRELADEMRPPVWGWFGQRDQFAMGSTYDPRPGVERFLSGTPAVLGAVCVEVGVELVAEAGIAAIRDKGMALTDFLVELADGWLAPLGFRVASPRDPERRGAHVALAHPDAWRICRALVERADVVPDFREPDLVRLGCSPLTTRFVDVWEAMDRLRSLVAAGVHEQFPTDRLPVT